MNAQKRKQIAALLSKVVDGRAGNSDMEALDLLMFDDGEARAYYLHYLAIHTDLERQGDRSGTIIPAKENHSKRWRPTAFAAAACALLAAGLGFWSTTRQPPKTTTSAHSLTTALQIENNQVLAVIGRSDQAEWDFPSTRPTQGIKLGRGPINLTSGKLRLDFKAGERVTIEGPARFELIDHQRLKLDQGSLVASVTQKGRGFTVIMPSGAIIDLGTEFAARVTADGRSQVRVIKGMVMASTTNQQGNTSWEELLKDGDEYVMIKDSPPRQQAFAGSLLTPLNSKIPNLPLGDRYTQSVLESSPLAYWKFNPQQKAQLIPSEIGDTAMALGGGATINDEGVLLLNATEGGHAISTAAFSQPNSASGSSIELWAISDSVEWQTLAGLMLDGPRPADLLPSLPRHNPHLLLLERASVSGSNWNHIHPDFAMRSVCRSPAGYSGGVNAYSNADYLIHEWHHFVVVNNAGQLLIYVDGELSGSTQSQVATDNQSYRLLLGRLHTLDTEEDARPWSGAIDDVSLYDRALSSEEIKRHYQAATR